jgi:hypothetical protein
MKARTFRLVFIAAGLSSAWPLAASAQTRAWDNYCTEGSFQACMSVEVSLTPVPWHSGDAFPGLFDNLTSVTVSIRNLQGTLGTNQSWGFQGLVITNLLPDPAPHFSVVTTGITPSFVGTAQDVNVPPNLLGGLWDYGYGTAGFINRSTQIGDGGYPIAGCAALPPDAFGLYHFELGFFSTCGNGWVTYSWLMQPVAFSDQTVVGMTGYHLSADGAVQTISCTFDVSCVSVTPEPATIVLVTTGLIGLAAFGWRRSRATQMR